MMKFLMLFFILLFSGCAVVSQETFVAANKPNVKSYFVEHQPNDKRGINELIESRIKQQGFNIVNSKTDADIIVNYIDLWYWDFTNYLLNLRIIFRDSGDSFPIIVGNSVHSEKSFISKPARGLFCVALGNEKYILYFNNSVF